MERDYIPGRIQLSPGAGRPQLRACVLSSSLVTLTAATVTHAQNAEKQLVMTITSEQLKGGVVSEILWDGGVLVLQGVFAQPSGELAAQYFVQPARGVAVEQRQAPTEAAARYWEIKSKVVSPTGLGRITTTKDEKMPMYGIASQEKRMDEAVDMGGTQVLHTVRLGDLLLHERTGKVAPYDGEVWGWSAAEVNNIAYVDKRGDLWIAGADGRNPTRVMRGNFTLPAWSDDGRQIAVAERKNGGRKWEISVITLPRGL
jgi:Tol biopolymer transport system component